MTDLSDRTLSELEGLDIDDVIDSAPSRLDQVLWRLSFCLICFVLIWVTSAPVTGALIGFALTTPTMNQTIDRWEVVLNSAAAQVETNVQCSDQAKAQCIASAEIAITKYREKLAQIQALEQQSLGDSKIILGKCQEEYSHIQNQFQIHINEEFPVFYEPTCTKAEIKRVKKIIGAQTNPMSRVLDKMDLRQVDWKNEIEGFADKVGKNVEEKLDALESTIDAVSSALSTASNAISSATNTVGNTVSNIGLVEALPENFDTILSPSALLDLFDGIQTPAFLGATTIWKDVFGILKSIDINFPPVESFLPIGTINLDGTLRELNLGIELFEQQIKTQMQSAIQEMKDRSQDLYDELNNRFTYIKNQAETLSHPFKDYNPPPLDFNVTLVDSLNLTISLPGFQEWKYSVQESLTEAKEEAKETTRSILATIKSIPETLSDLKLPELGSVDWGVGKVKSAIQPTIDLFNTIYKVLVIYDIVYRVEASLKTVFFYGKASFSQLPVLDIRREEDQGPLIDTISQLPIAFLGPLITILVVVVLVVTIVIIVIVRYTKLYSSYVKGCVNSKQGTFLTKNANNIAFNLLNDTTSTYSQEQEQLYTGEIYGRCKAVYAESQNDGNDAQYQLRFDQQEFIQFSTDLELLGRCIAPMTYSYPSSDLNYPGLYLAHNPLPTATNFYVNQRGILEARANNCPLEWSTEAPWHTATARSAGDCLVSLPPCAFQEACQPSPAQLSVSTHYAGCDTEWYLHSTIIKLFLTILVMICLNVARVFIMKFLVMFFFRELGTINVEVLLNYRFRTMKCTVKRSTIIEEINNLIKGHRRKALIFLGIALVCQIPYLTALFWFMNFGVPTR